MKRKHVKILYGNIVFESVPFILEEVLEQITWYIDCFHTLSYLYNDWRMQLFFLRLGPIIMLAQSTVWTCWRNSRVTENEWSRY